MPKTTVFDFIAFALNEDHSKKRQLTDQEIAMEASIFCENLYGAIEYIKKFRLKKEKNNGR